MSLTATQLRTFKQAVAKAKHILILQPERIDPDSIGSATALTQLLRGQGKRVTNFSYQLELKGIDQIFSPAKITNRLPKSWDLTILVDCGGPSQLAETFAQYLEDFNKRKFLIIDHHASRDPMPFQTIDLIDSQAAATGQQIAELAEHFKWPLTKNSALAIAGAIVTDTLNLSTKNVNSKTLTLMARLVDQGVNLEQLRIRLEQSYALRPSELPLKIKLLERTAFYDQKRIAITYLNLNEYRSADLESALGDSVKQELRRLKGVQVAVLISERQPGLFKVSMRANIPVAGVVAAQLGGGGHDKAASGSIESSDVQAVIKQVVKLVTAEIKKDETL